MVPSSNLSPSPMVRIGKRLPATHAEEGGGEGGLCSSLFIYIYLLIARGPAFLRFFVYSNKIRYI